MKTINISKKIFAAALAVGMLFSSCDDRFEKLNQNPNQVVEVTPDLILPYIQNGMSAHRFESWRGNVLYAMHYSCLMSSPWLTGSEFLAANDAWTQGMWDRAYQRLGGNLQAMVDFIEEQPDGPDKNAQLAIADVMRVLIYHRLTDFFGDVPYSEAGLGMEGIFQPKYDSQEDIYKDMLSRLETAAQNLRMGENTYGVQDIFYQGEEEGWIRLANSLRLRLAMRISDVEPQLAASHISAVINEPLITTNEWICKMPHEDDGSQWSSGSNGTSAPISAFDAHFMAKALVDNMQDDPRLDLYGRKLGSGEIVGYPSGTVPSDVVLPSFTPDNFSLLNSSAGAVFDLGNDWIHVSAAEVNLLLAEAAFRGIGMTQSDAQAESYYQEGITQGLSYWGLSSNPAFEANVAFDAADGLNQIITQKWIALFPDGFEAFAELRRTDLPRFAADQVYGELPKRHKYPLIEQSLNSENYSEAVSRQGQDIESTSLWWDVN
ncbi:SusD/RagB family nutrient-binding outer membrane lipoprotein [Marinigracilibium pacificum]|uniref:SusD/RagB family nutrient-binding outer membrane lipoprotein n=1 Tax=Marinigracilibium pacificum TaxID=2729599 RepID=A0A848J6Q4_9BACT|nr:SusD/RagB family nutrient-binding outer membrane lipoprotein [Marinigracilibium pacificum]NMM50134.1 SusD/RagB family nutrient-binding outer membrane lipoprotein [Marinigracilibium pacificum]